MKNIFIANIGLNYMIWCDEKPLKVQSYVLIDDHPLEKLATAVSNVMNLYPVSHCYGTG